MAPIASADPNEIDNLPLADVTEVPQSTEPNKGPDAPQPLRF